MHVLQGKDLNQYGDFGKVFDKFTNQWMLLTAGIEEKANTMTISWGNVGVLWHRPMVNVFVRPERYTYEFMEKESFFTLSVFGEEYREALAFCGKESGRDVDKFSHCGFSVKAAEGGGLFIPQAKENIICKKMYRTEFQFEQMEKDFDFTPYYNEKKGALHVMYMGEIVKHM